MNIIPAIDMSISRQYEWGSIYVYAAILLLFILLTFLMLRREKRKRDIMITNKITVMQKAFDVCEDAILLLSNEKEVLYVNKAMQKFLHLGENNETIPLDDLIRIRKGKKRLTLGELSEGTDIKKGSNRLSLMQTTLLLHNKEEREVNLYIDTLEADDASSAGWSIVSIHDLSEEKQKEEAEYYHRLTGLPNQLKVLQDINVLNAKLHLSGGKVAAMLIDIDNLSVLRSIIGVEQTNLILKKFARYLTELSKETAFTAYHTFYNDFLLIIPDIEDVEEVRRLAERIEKELSRFYKLGESRLYLSASIGISIYPDSGPIMKLLDFSYKALAESERNGYGRIEFYFSELQKANYDELILYNDMHAAIERKQFEMYYQPIIDARTKEVMSAEALIRWHHPEYGMIPPDLFISIAEKTGFIVELGRFVLKEVLKQQKRWELFKFRQIRISINLSLHELETGHFVDHVIEMLEEHQVHPELIQYEITEGLAMKNEEKLAEEFQRLRKLGVGIVLDDFGTGYTSFAYLKKFPATVLKIDKILIEHIMENRDDKRIVKAIIDLGHSLGMKIVVEGITNREVADLLENYGCDYMQGYYFSKPLPVFEFQKTLR